MVHVGNWVNDQVHGLGKLTSINGDTYEGDFKNGLMKGEGTFTSADGQKWVQNSQNRVVLYEPATCELGHPVIFYPTGTNKQRRHKEGGSIHISLEDNFICNSCENNFSIARQGGLYSCEDTCDFNICTSCKCRMEGMIPTPLLDQSPPEYEGETSPEGKKHGQGIIKYRNGNKYEGEWQDDKRCGQGKYTQADGFIYEGDWRDDWMYGQGSLTVPNQYNYVGSFEYGMMHGNGV